MREIRGSGRSTPIVPAPVHALAVKREVSSGQLEVPFIVVWTGGDHENQTGELVIGRSSKADIRLTDSLVSRQHARISTTADGSLVVEDLNSANGVFVNGSRIQGGSEPLHEGDRLLIGTTELSLFGARSSATLPIHKAAPKEPAATPIARVKTHTIVRHLAAVPDTATKTERTNTVEVVARLAARLFASGRSTDGIRLLSEHLDGIFAGAQSGLPIPSEVLHAAVRHALELASRTGDTSWIDYVLQLHTHAEQLPNDDNLAALELVLPRSARSRARELLKALLARLEPASNCMTREQRGRLARLRRLAPRQ